MKHYLNHWCLFLHTKSQSLYPLIVSRDCWLLMAAELIGVDRFVTKNFYWKVINSCFSASLAGMSKFAVNLKRTISSTYGLCFVLSNRLQTQKFFSQQSVVYLTQLSLRGHPAIPCSLTPVFDANPTLLEVFEWLNFDAFPFSQHGEWCWWSFQFPTRASSADPSAKASKIHQ